MSNDTISRAGLLEEIKRRRNQATIGKTEAARWEKIVKAFPAAADTTRFDMIKACSTPEEMVIILNANARRFCPKEYDKKPDACCVPCGTCIANWLKEEPDEKKSCYSCHWGGDGKEVNDVGHCWKHNGEPDFIQPPKCEGCDEWEAMTC